MIQLNELRIGNIVSLLSDPIKVDAIYHDSISAKMGTLKTQYRIKDLVPIPLTEGILLKAGFEKKYKSEDNEYLLSLLIQSRGGYGDLYFSAFAQNIESVLLVSADEPANNSIICFECVGEEVSAKYLHQLQNLYFALVGKELEVKL